MSSRERYIAILEIFAERQNSAGFRDIDPFGYSGVTDVFGRADAVVIPGQHRARKTTRTRLVQCTQCGRKGHYAPQCTFYEDWYEPPEWLRHPSTMEETQEAYEAKDRMMWNFRFAHLPPRLQEVSKAFAETARWTVDNIPAGPERTVALRKLLEGKDCAVRARLQADEAEDKAAKKG